MPFEIPAQVDLALIALLGVLAAVMGVRQWRTGRAARRLLGALAEAHTQLAAEPERERFLNALRALHEVRNELALIADWQAMCRRAVELGHARLGFDRLSLWFTTETPFEVIGSFGIDEAGGLRDERDQRLTAHPGSVMWQAIHERQVQVAADTALCNHRAEVIGHGAHAVAPLWDGHRVIGCLAADDYPTGRAFSLPQQELLTLFAEMLGHLVTLKRIDQARRESELRYRTLFTQASDGILIIDPDTLRPVEFNDAACRQLGYTREEFARLTLREIEANESPAEVARHSARLLWEGHGTFITRHRTKSGHLRDVQVSARTLDTAGKVSLHVIFHDITEFRRTNELLRASEAKYRALFENMHEMVTINELLTDEAGRPVDWLISDVNPAFLATFAHRREEVVGRRASELFGVPHPIDDFVALFARTLVTGQPVPSELFFPAQGIHCQLTAFPLGERRFALVAIDITERKRAEEELRQHQQELRALAAEALAAEERERRRLAQEVHDSISQTLALAKIRLGNLRATLETAEAREHCADIMALLDQSIQHTRTLTFALSLPILYELGLDAAIEWLAEDLQRHNGVDITVEHGPRLSAIPEDLRAFLFMATREILINVVKHARATRATVRLHRDDAQLLITVTDDGIGFDVDRLNKPHGRRTGFGLFSLRERLRYLGGWLDIASSPGAGTTVTLHAPEPRE